MKRPLFILQVFFNDVIVKQVDVATLNGSIGILAKHVPVLGMLKPGIVRVIDDNGKYIIHSIDSIKLFIFTKTFLICFFFFLLPLMYDH